jgi:hypothetical protein
LRAARYSPAGCAQVCGDLIRGQMSTPLARCRAHVLFQTVAEGGVLLDTETEVYFGLNAVGARVCSLLPEHDTLEELCSALGRDYPEVAQEVLNQDVGELLAKLVGFGLLEHPDSAPEESGSAAEESDSAAEESGRAPEESGRVPAHAAESEDPVGNRHAGRAAP